jgi:hypothetical protein
MQASDKTDMCAPKFTGMINKAGATVWPVADAIQVHILRECFDLQRVEGVMFVVICEHLFVLPLVYAANVCAHIHMLVFGSTSVYTYLYIYLFVCICVCIYIHKYVCTYIYICIYAHIHNI